MSKFLINKQFFEMKLNNKRLELDRAKITNSKIEKVQARKQHADLLYEDLSKYIDTLKSLQRLCIQEDSRFKQRRLSYINDNITDSLLSIFPNEGFKAKITYDTTRNKNYATLSLFDANNVEKFPYIQEGKMCQYLISFSAVYGVANALGCKNIFIDEAFGAASSDNLQKMGPILDIKVKNGFQIILVSQNPVLYENVPRREICFHKDPVEAKVIIDSINDYTC